MIYELKVYAEPFAALLAGTKTCEIRRLDRPFKAGDTVLLREFEPCGQTYSGRKMTRTITHIQEGFGLPEGVGVLSYGNIRFIPAVKVVHGPKGSDGAVDFVLQELQDWGLDNLPDGALLYIRGVE